MISRSCPRLRPQADADPGGAVKRWIDQGASYSPHWAYVPPKRPAVPEVKDKSWIRNPIDDFILARLRDEGLRPSPEADRATLLRRVSFDLTGLPPTPTQVRAFVQDKSANAYEKQVDRLLASPRYGENMARMWLDLARYGDSHGYDVDHCEGCGRGAIGSSTPTTATCPTTSSP